MLRCDGGRRGRRRGETKTRWPGHHLPSDSEKPNGCTSDGEASENSSATHIRISLPYSHRSPANR